LASKRIAREITTRPYLVQLDTGLNSSGMVEKDLNKAKPVRISKINWLCEQIDELEECINDLSNYEKISDSNRNPFPETDDNNFFNFGGPDVQSR